MILCQPRSLNRSILRIGYRKAYEFVPHAGILKSLYWSTTSLNQVFNWLLVKSAYGVLGVKVLTQSIPIRQGVFQCDAFSPLNSCLVINPQRFLLNMGGGYHGLTILCYLNHNMPYSIPIDILTSIVMHKLQCVFIIWTVQTITPAPVKTIITSVGIVSICRVQMYSYSICELYLVYQ